MKTINIHTLGHLIALAITSGDIRSVFRNITCAKSIMTIIKSAVNAVLVSDVLDLKNQVEHQANDGYTYQANIAVDYKSRQATIHVVKHSPTGGKGEILSLLMAMPEAIPTTPEADGMDWFLNTSVCHHRVVIQDNNNVLRECKEASFKTAIAAKIRMEPFLLPNKSYTVSYEKSARNLDTVTFRIPTVHIGPECTHIAYFEANNQFMTITTADFMVQEQDRQSALADLFSNAVAMKSALGCIDESPVSVLSVPFSLPVWAIDKVSSKEELFQLIAEVKAQHSENENNQ